MSETKVPDFGSVLVVGGGGFVGRHVISYLLEHEPTARTESLSLHQPRAFVKQPNVKYHAADIANKQAVKQVLTESRPRVVIHTASPRPFIHRPSIYQKANIEGTRNLIEACQQAGSVKAYVYTSSVSVVHDGFSDLKMADESAPVLYAPEQQEPYWHSKAVAETDVLRANRTGPQPMLTTALRVTSIFGPDDYHIVSSLTERAAKGALNTQIGDNKNLNDWTYVGNVAYAHWLAARRLLQAGESPQPAPHDARVEGEAFFITNDDPRLFWTFARSVAAACGHPVDENNITSLPRSAVYIIGFVLEYLTWTVSLGRRRSEINRRSLSFSVMTQTFSQAKAQNQLGYRPLVGIEEAIKLSVQPFSVREAGRPITKPGFHQVLFAGGLALLCALVIRHFL